MLPRARVADLQWAVLKGDDAFEVAWLQHRRTGFDEVHDSVHLCSSAVQCGIGPGGRPLDGLLFPALGLLAQTFWRKGTEWHVSPPFGKCQEPPTVRTIAFRNISTR